jgi:IS1 family transposase
MKILKTEQRVKVLSALVEGVGVNATCRMMDVAKNTVLKLLRDVGEVCAVHHDQTVRNLSTRRVECDEVWSFVFSKAKNVPAEKRGHFGIGDVWTWTAIDSNSKLLISYLVGLRDAGYAFHFMQDVASRLSNRVQLTTDAHKPYLEAVENTFGDDIDYAQLVKIYGTEQIKGETRYSPPKCLGARPRAITGNPNADHISTSYIERSNLTLRLMNRRFTRLTLGFSKKIENHIHAIALFAFHYNFCKIHSTLRVTPAMEAGLTDHVWELRELVALLEAKEKQARESD